MNHLFRITRFFILIGILTPIYVCAQVEMQFVDQDGEPLPDVTLVLKPLFEFDLPPPEETSIDQRDQEFVPRVKVVQSGANIYFPNQDEIRHHVYSFSPAKQFDIPLYSGTPQTPIIFDQPGLVELGCNIHDQMRGYILVADTPYFGVSDTNGNITISPESIGRYELSIWHPEQSEELPSIEITLDDDLSYQNSFQITTAAFFVPRRGSSNNSYF